jgi:transcriptional regulator of acetoin/glycerol metabolism
MEEKRIKTLAEIEKEALLDSLERHSYNVSAVVDELDITRYTFYSLIVKHGIKKPEKEDIMN